MVALSFPFRAALPWLLCRGSPSVAGQQGCSAAGHFAGPSHSHVQLQTQTLPEGCQQHHGCVDTCPFEKVHVGMFRAGGSDISDFVHSVKTNKAKYLRVSDVSGGHVAWLFICITTFYPLLKNVPNAAGTWGQGFPRTLLALSSVHADPASVAWLCDMRLGPCQLSLTLTRPLSTWHPVGI